MVDGGDEREHHAAAVPVGERADHDAAQRADEHRHRDQQRDVGLGERTERPESRNSGPSGLISAQAQKFTAKPSVARASINNGEPLRGFAPASMSGALVPSAVATEDSFIASPSEKGRTATMAKVRGSVTPDSPRTATAVPETSVPARPGPEYPPTGGRSEAL